MTTDVTEGGCLCGAIRYRITSGSVSQSICHCRTCRLASGAPSVAWATFRVADFAFASGEPVHFRSSSPVVRTFCGRCGTPLTYQDDSSADTIDVTTVTLDSPNNFAPTREIWVEHKIAWESLNETLPHYPRSSGEGQSGAG
jgi:hypothetical protein